HAPAQREGTGGYTVQVCHECPGTVRDVPPTGRQPADDGGVVLTVPERPVPERRRRQPRALRVRRARARSVTSTTTTAAAIAATAVTCDSGSPAVRPTAIQASPHAIASVGARRPPRRIARSEPITATATHSTTAHTSGLSGPPSKPESAR